MNTITPQLVSYTSEQPLQPFVKFIIAGHELTNLPPRFIESFEVTDTVEMLEDGSTTGASTLNFSVTMFDPYWDEIEQAIIAGYDAVYFMYGYANGLQSSLYHAQSIIYNVTFTPGGTRITLSGIGVSAGAYVEKFTFDTKTLNPVEAAKAICKQKGWKIAPESFPPCNDVALNSNDSFTLLDESPSYYIMNTLAKYAVRSSDGIGGYRFYLDDRTNPPTAYFQPTEIADGKGRTYIYGKGINSVVKSFSLDTGETNVAGGLTVVATGVTTTFLDVDTKEEITLSADTTTMPQNASGEYTMLRPNSSVEVVDSVGATRSQMAAQLNYRIQNINYPYVGTLEILGDPTIVYNDQIRIIVLTDRGNMHHSSGLYFVTGTSTSLAGGALTTVLQVSKKSDLEMGLALESYRALIR